MADMPSFLHDLGLIGRQWEGRRHELIARKANITSFGVLGAAFGAIIALAITDKLGRLRTWQTFMAVWMTGFFITTFSSGIMGLLLFSRLFSGVGAGGLTVVAPLYLTEIARSKSRGMVVSVYMVLLLSFLMFGWSLKDVSYKLFMHSSLTWRLYRVLHQLWSQKVSSPIQGAISRCTMRAFDTWRHCLVLFVVSQGHSSLACIEGP